MKKLLVLGGTRISCEIIKKAKEKGIYVVVTDYNMPEMSPGKQIADKSFMVSCTNVDGVLELINREHIDGVLVGFNDLLLPYYAEICEKAGLPSYGTKEQFEIFTNKDRYKMLMRKYNIPTVEDYDVNLENFSEDVKKVRFPVLVKPADSSGARGISICGDAVQLKGAYQKALKYSRSGKVLIEQYLTGKEATIFWMFREGKYYLCGIGNRHVKQNQDNVIPLPVGYTFPAKVTPVYIAETEENAKKMFYSVGIKNGMMFMQCKVENDRCVVYDIGYRLTGSLEYKLFKEVNGYDPLEMMIDFALTGYMGDLDNTPDVDPFFEDGYPYNVSCLAKPGKIQKFVGIEEVRGLPGVIDVVPAHAPGEEITSDMKGLLSQITVRVLGIARKKEDIIPIMKEIEHRIKIISDTGEELMLPGIEDDDIEDVI